jgi:hypothetical protein
MEAMKRDNKTLYVNEKIRDLSDTKRNCKIIKDKNQQILTTLDELLERWVEHF